MGSGDDDSAWTNYNGHIVGRMYRNHDLNQNTTNVKSSGHLGEMTNRQDGKSPCKEPTNWKLNGLSSPHGKTSPNSNLPFKNAFFTEDSCSNDFFYDEEFTIPFDANLTEQRDSDEGFLPRLGVVTSKSDNCLYLGDVDHLGSDREASGSDREIFSSSDSSELFNQPLFSSHSECPDEFALDASGDEASIVEDDLPKDVQKLNHIKHHYKISFDKGPLKVWSSSDEPASKTSLELRPSYRVANKPTTLGLQKNGEKVANHSSTCHRPGNGPRKSKKKSSQKSSQPWNSKSSHLVTWGTLKNSPSTSESSKSRTTWKEMNSKPSLSAQEEEAEEQIQTKNSTKSCNEMNSDERSVKSRKHPDADKLEEIQTGSTKPLQSGEKTCELFKIFQDKKLKEAEECMDELDELDASNVPHEPFGLCDEAAPPGKEEDCTFKCNFPDLQDIFESTKKPKSEKKLKFKSHSIEPNNSSPVQDPEKSPKIVQSANLASTTSTDSSVQTSLIISIPVKTENKSLQTSLTFAEEKQHPETSGRDIWNTSSYLFSRPLPDLSFLKNSSKFMESKIEAAPTKQPKSAPKEEAKSGKKSNPQSQNKSGLKQTFVKSKALSNSKTSQESSGRSKSSSSFSFNSSSSSGIDPGTSDSGRQSSSASSKDESLHSDISKTPPKPPRLFKAANPGDTKDGAPVKDEGTTKITENVKEPSSKTSSEVRNARNFTRGNHQARRSPSLQDKVDLTQNRGSKVILRSSNNQPGYAQPTKSILVRSRSKENRRSWSNNFQTGSAESHVSAERVSPRKRPLSVPDGTLLELATPMQEEGKQLEGNIAPSKGSEDDTLATTVAADDDKSHSKEDGTNNGGAPGDHDYEKFRAKKSVSFSETISYHPTTSSLSPLESPKSPVNSVPASPDVDPPRDVSKCSPDSTHDTTEDVELPPNDFLVSPNISPASSLSDSSSNLHPLNFDLQQKKDLVMDVVKAVEVIFRHVGRCKDPLAKAKLCSTVDNPKIGNLLLEHLCPSIHAIVLDGIKPNIPGLFGRTKSSACKVFEDSLEGSPFDSLNHLMKSMKDLKFLSNPWLKFNAYLFALLNLKVLDMWLASLRKNRSVLARYYNPTSFLQLSSSSACQVLFLDVVAALQPLSQIQFRLEYDFEVNVVERKRQAFIAEQLLNKHISCSGEVHAETESYLSRMYSTFSLDSPASARAPKHPASSLCFDEKSCCEATKNQEAAEENSEASIFLLWSSVDFGGLARGILQKTQNKLIEKLSQSRDMFSFDAGNSPGRNCKQQNGSGMSESSTQQKPPGQPSDSFSSPDRPLPQMSRSECPRSCPEFNGSPCGDGEHSIVTEKTGNAVLQNQKQAPPPIPKTDPIPPNPMSNLTSPPNGLKPSAVPQKPQGGLLSSYGTKIVGVFDRLLLNEGSVKSDGDLFIIRKKYHSEDQISRHVMDSPKNGLSKQTAPILAKSVSCESDKERRSKTHCDGRPAMLASSNSSRLRFARSLCHYVAMNNQFLSFEKDVEMSVVKEVGHDFFLCRLNGHEGLVYKVCVSVVG